MCLSTFKPSEASFSLQRSLAFPFRAFLLLSDRFRVSSASSALALSQQTCRPVIGASAAFSHLRSRSPLSLPEGLVRVGAVLLSWVFLPLGLSLRLASHGSVSLPWLPFRILGSKGLTTHRTPYLKVSLYAPWLSPLVRGAGPSGIPHLLSRTTCSKPCLLRTIFSSRDLGHLATTQPSLFAATNEIGRAHV